VEVARSQPQPKVLMLSALAFVRDNVHILRKTMRYPSSLLPRFKKHSCCLKASCQGPQKSHTFRRQPECPKHRKDLVSKETMDDKS
jgi:hypothetical protein